MTLIELPRRKAEPRIFVQPAPDLHRRVSRALKALDGLPEGLELPGLDDLADALISIADELEGDADLEDDELGDEEAFPLFSFAGLTRR
ncbi:hypothetical protein AMST5_03615 [freshwater sediment metagenome]|uniref:Uncharacterized protein n=1 Tax=freshwater sediment metagenome TaxID=556182 RepID=A0AA48M6P7_9ZZZZ